jgi:hypothetical protein
MSGAEPVTPYLPVHVLCSEPIKPVLRPVTCIPQADVTGWRSKAPLLCGGTGAMRSPRLWASMARSHLLSAGRTRRQAGCKVRPERQPPSPAPSQNMGETVGLPLAGRLSLQGVSAGSGGSLCRRFQDGRSASYGKASYPQA